MGNVVKKSRPNLVIDETGKIYPSIRKLREVLHVRREVITPALAKGGFSHNGHIYKLYDYNQAAATTENNEEQSNPPANLLESMPEYQEFLEAKKARLQEFQNYDIQLTHHKNGSRYAIALFSDAHIEERVNPASVQYLNEYNVKIAEERITKYFSNLASCLNEDRVEDLIFACLGDIISGFIHDELSQCNELTPLEAIYKAQSLLFSGLQFLCKNTSLNKITFIGIVGNHSRTTKKIQHANGYKMNYEWLMYQNLRDKCKDNGLPIDFNIPDSEVAVVNTDDGKCYMFAHGFQIKGSGTGTVCGIYPALNRLTMKWDRTFRQNKVFIGHFHSCTSIPNAVVNGSIIGYNAFALSNGMPYEEPAQMYEVHDTIMGELLARKIYCK